MSARTGVLRLALPLVAGLLVACNRAPDRADALDALRAASPGIDTTTVFARVWQDGPPWFSCAEVIAKLSSAVDSAVVRDQVGNWKQLVVSGWLVLRDSSHGVVSDPGWCVGKPSDPAARQVAGWIPILGDSFPTGTQRRGWRVPIGTRRLAVVGTPKAGEKDVASVEYVSTVAANANGIAMGADRDTTFAVAELRRRDGRWHVASTRLGRAVTR